jgi:hypothetical protein
VDLLAHALGIELVAETEHGLMFAASDDITLGRFEEVLTAFEIGTEGAGGSNAANILDIFAAPDDRRKMVELLAPKVWALWPFADEKIYTFDIAIQTAPSTRHFEWTRIPRKKKSQTPEEHAALRSAMREADRIRASDDWSDAADRRIGELQEILLHYNGIILDGYHSDNAEETRAGIIYPDSAQLRVRMSGKGFRDVAQNFPYVFEIGFPEDVLYLPGSPEADGSDGDLVVAVPPQDAAAVCFIDSGIQEDHRWLSPAMDKR